MKRKHLARFVLLGLLGGVLAYAGLCGWFVRQLGPEDLLIGSTNKQVFRFPFNHPFLIRWYLMHVRGVDPAYRTSTGQTLLQFALAGYDDRQPVAGRENSLALARWLLSQGVDKNATGVQGLTALHEAVLYRSPVLVQFLVAQDVDVNRPAGHGQFNGRTPLSFARHLLGKRGPDPLLQGVIERLEAAGGKE